MKTNERDDRIAFQRQIIRAMNLQHNPQTDLAKPCIRDSGVGDLITIPEFFKRYSVAIAVMDDFILQPNPQPKETK